METGGDFKLSLSLLSFSPSLSPLGFSALISEPVKFTRRGTLDSKGRGKGCEKGKWGGEWRIRYAEQGRQGQRRQIQLEAAYLGMGSFGTAAKLNDNVPNDEMIEWTFVNVLGGVLCNSKLAAQSGNRFQTWIIERFTRLQDLNVKTYYKHGNN